MGFRQLIIFWWCDKPRKLQGAFQSFLQAVQHDFIGCLCLAIALWISQSRQVLFDSILHEESGDLFANELRLIVSDQRLQAAKLADDVSPNESFHIDFLSRGQSFNLYPFSKVIGGNDHHVLGRSWWHGTHYVDCPLHEWPWAILRMIHFSQQTRNQILSLASITSFDILRRVQAHGRPEAAFTENFLGE